MRQAEMIPYAVGAMMLIVIIAFFIIIFAVAPRAGMVQERPPAATREINAEKMAREFVFNWPKAMERYLDQWFTVSAGPVNKVANRRATIEYEGITLRMYFNSRDDTWTIEPDQDITAVCKLTNARNHNRSITMKGCQWPEPEPDTRYPRRRP